MRLAHLILAHTNPSQLERLVRRLVYDNTDIYIHLDKKCDISEFSHLGSLKDVFFITKRVTVTWANYSMVRATLSAMKEILDTGANYSHINLLSGADYPLKSAGKIQDFLFAHAGQTFMKYRHVYNDWEESKSRFTLYSLGDFNLPLKFKLQKFLNWMVDERKLPNGLEPYGFSQWFTITPECVNYVIGYLNDNAAVKRFFRMTWAADELVFQTILLNSHLKNVIVNDHLRYIKFQERAPNPEILTIKDKELLTTSAKLYARKFSAEIDVEILNYLDQLAEKEAFCDL